MVDRRSHNPFVVGSIPTSTNLSWRTANRGNGRMVIRLLWEQKNVSSILTSHKVYIAVTHRRQTMRERDTAGTSFTIPYVGFGTAPAAAPPPYHHTV